MWTLLGSVTYYCLGESVHHSSRFDVELHRLHAVSRIGGTERHEHEHERQVHNTEVNSSRHLFLLWLVDGVVLIQSSSSCWFSGASSLENVVTACVTEQTKTKYKQQ